jgi:hypothetical protein
MAVVSILGGIAIVAIVIWEVFQDLFRPAASGALSDWIGRRLFSVLRRFPAMLPLAGPAAIVAMIGAWIILLVLGFGLMYYGAFPGQFATSTGAAPAEPSRLLASMYISFETLITLGYGDLVPRSAFARFVSTTEALIGFGLLTASVSLLVLLYPALARMRTLARSVSNVVAGEQHADTPLVATNSDVILVGLARDVTHTRIDLVHFPIIYYFATDDPRASLAYWTPQLVRWGRACDAAEIPAHVKLAAAALEHALSDLAGLLERRFVDVESADPKPFQVFEAYARDHCIREQAPSTTLRHDAARQH